MEKEIKKNISQKNYIWICILVVIIVVYTFWYHNKWYNYGTEFSVVNHRNAPIELIELSFASSEEIIKPVIIHQNGPERTQAKIELQARPAKDDLIFSIRDLADNKIYQYKVNLQRPAEPPVYCLALIPQGYEIKHCGTNETYLMITQDW
ncbi:MAG: hypothetical protein EYC62_05790 [Alphaproteobacteria bacterium]|nr:MAG: hypothetical protein EYC62_05790 [Alphaproteobacteria bacterium]